MSGFPMPGQRIGPYLVVREIGRGPVGVVLEGLDTASPSGPVRVALKVHTPHTTLQHGLRARYVADLDRLAGIHSARLLPVLRVGVHDDRLLTVTPYVAGGNVATRLDAGPLNPDTALAWATALAEGLAAVHEAGLVHGGVRTQNLLLPADGELPVLADVGAALLHQAWLRPPGTTEVAIPPEGRSLGRAGDIWSAGQLIRALVAGTPGPALAEVIRRATDADPARRYADGAALARALRLVPPGDVPAGRAAGERSAWRGRPGVLVGVAGLGVVAAAVGAFALLSGGGGESAGSPHAAPPALSSSAAPVADAPAPDRPRLSAAAGYRSVVFTLHAPSGVGVEVDRGAGWRAVAERTVTVPTTAGGERACLRARSVRDDVRSPAVRACGRSEAPVLTTVRQPDCLIDGAYRQVCYSLVARGFAPGRDERLTFTVAGRSMGTATVHVGRDGTGTLPGGQHFHFADADAGSTARIEMGGVTHTWQVDRRD